MDEQYFFAHKLLHFNTRNIHK